MPAARTTDRLAWLDGLRAVAALLVLYAHLSHHLLRPARAVSAEWLHAGTAGVLLFFLVSGYIVPASLERHGDLRSFWVNRVFRLFPLYLAVGGLVAALGAAGLVPVDPYLAAHPGTAALAHATMLPHLLGVPLLTAVFWTLTFEMVFYLLISALWALRLRRAAAPVALALGGAGVLSAPLPATLPPPAVAVPAAAVVLVLGLAAVTSGRRWAAPAGGLLLAGLAGTLLAAGQDPAHAWDGLLIVAVMFAGATLHRADHARTGRRRAALVAALACAAVGAALVVVWFAELAALGAPTATYRARAVLTLAVVAGAFALARWAGRAPRPLAALGRISYSVYLLHVVLIQLLAPVLGRLADRLPLAAEAVAAAAFTGLLAGLSWLTWRYVELPGQRLGRHLSRHLSGRRSSRRAGRRGGARPEPPSGGDGDRDAVVVRQRQPGPQVAVLGDPLEVVRAAAAEQRVRARRGDELR
ncbi:hypothetical protein Sya03_44570 [Spirilliplanes yamanashiensis]|uniref:Acyltransferase 3 domain-containing protein n=1 Tax=Spirilliplanes yamanashiensis TaxID=42233 RepID=A0A8J3YBU2_9ACTN|nr:peptidoglycan/LPS O-acetylase OafA/YrhL [Spirilliplanes yamanashiensis]GIJ05105.1 hypothetical protein Sya03_44570 [Spirilliplanes yamanashiensis]